MSFYKYVTGMSKIKNVVRPLKDSDGNVFIDEKTMGEMSDIKINLSSVFTVENDGVPEVTENVMGDGELNDVVFYEDS